MKRRTRRFAVSVAVVAAGWGGWIWLNQTPPLNLDALNTSPITAGDVSRGEYVFRLAGCEGCHTDSENGGPYLAGGRGLTTPFGTFRAPNITPDENTGMGGWSLTDFARALKLGVSPQGKRYYPAFPYTSYTEMSLDDVRSLYAYLSRVAPVEAAPARHDVPWYVSRATMTIWQRLFFEPADHVPRAEHSDEWNRGRYIATALGHCGECHTPRDGFGAMLEDRFLAGAKTGPDGEAVPDITASREHGIGEWTRNELWHLFSDGLLPDGDFVGGSMAEVVENSLADMSDEDRRALVIYLKTVAPREAR